MNNLQAIRIAVLYLPLTAAMLVGFLRPRHPRMFASCLLSTLWTLPALLILQRINIHFGWWGFAPEAIHLLQMPLEFYIGWAAFWGLVPQLTFRRLNLFVVIAIMATFDLCLMPLCAPALTLHRHWLLGEAAALFLALTPALCIARWTLHNTHLQVRAALQVATSGLVFLYLLPEIAFAIRPAANISSVWQPMLTMPHLLRQAALQIIFLFAVPGISAVQEFAERGHGTPIPYDPPVRLVTSGIYRYCANPMQLSCAVVMLLWALLLRNPWLVLAAALSAIYSAGIAHWDEDQDLSARFGEPWKQYRAVIRPWRLRWRPYHSGPPARLYIARTCQTCSQLRRWIEHHEPIGLQLIDAETLPAGSITRLRYEPADGSPHVEGVVAFARVLEHIHLVYAYCGITLRLPVFRQAFQLLLDASGLGPRKLPATCATDRPSHSS